MCRLVLEHFEGGVKWAISENLSSLSFISSWVGWTDMVEEFEAWDLEVGSVISANSFCKSEFLLVIKIGRWAGKKGAVAWIKSPKKNKVVTFSYCSKEGCVNTYVYRKS